MGGLLIFILGALYIWGAAKAVGLVEMGWAKTLLILVFVLIPTADAIYGRIKLHQMCEAEGGLHIYRVVEGVEGFDEASRPYDEWVLKYGYRFVEGDEADGKKSRLSLRPDGKVVLAQDVTPIAEYIYERDKGDSSDVFDRSGSHIRAKSTGEILSRYVNISYAGGWFERFVGGVYASHGSVAWCKPVVSVHEIVLKTLKPINQEQPK